MLIIETLKVKIGNNNKQVLFDLINIIKLDEIFQFLQF
jgi:hypothetical protein